MERLKRVAQSQMIELPAGRFQYLSWGTEQTERPSVLLLHGYALPHLRSAFYLPLLQAKYGVHERTSKAEVT
jgi:hypothetical protein